MVFRVFIGQRTLLGAWIIKPHHSPFIWLEWWFILKGYIFIGYFTIGERVRFSHNE